MARTPEKHSDPKHPSSISKPRSNPGRKSFDEPYKHKPVLNSEKMLMRAMGAKGMSIRGIAKQLDRPQSTVNLYVNKKVTTDEKQIALNDPVTQSVIAEMERNELNDLALLGGKARQHLHVLLDGGDMKPIETIAAMDRTFQQKRLLQGKSTSNINSLSWLITKATEAREKNMVNEPSVIDAPKTEEEA